MNDTIDDDLINEIEKGFKTYIELSLIFKESILIYEGYGAKSFPFAKLYHSYFMLYEGLFLIFYTSEKVDKNNIRPFHITSIQLLNPDIFKTESELRDAILNFIYEYNNYSEEEIKVTESMLRLFKEDLVEIFFNNKGNIHFKITEKGKELMKPDRKINFL